MPTKKRLDTPMQAYHLKPEDLPYLRDKALIKQRKWDGVRAWRKKSLLLARSGHPIRNRTFKRLAKELFDQFPNTNFDMELVLFASHPELIRTGDVPFNETFSWVSREQETDEQKEMFEPVLLVFDQMMSGLTYNERYQDLYNKIVNADTWRATLVKNEQFDDPIPTTWEGVIYRSPTGLYKPGRSTLAELLLLAWCERIQSKGVIVDVTQLVDMCGTTKEMIGALTVQLPGLHKFNIGTGFTLEQRRQWWKEPPIGREVVFSHKPFGQQELPRQPSFIKLV